MINLLTYKDFQDTAKAVYIRKQESLNINELQDNFKEKIRKENTEQRRKQKTRCHIDNQ